MKRVVIIAISLLISSAFIFDTSFSSNTKKRKFNFKKVKLELKNGDKSSAKFFQGDSSSAVIFVSGALFNSKSWNLLADQLQSRGLSSLSLDEKNTSNVFSAIDFLKQKGNKQVALVGASMGGAVVLDVVNEPLDDIVKKVILLAPFSEKIITNKKLSKLFIVSEEDSSDQVQVVYDKSSTPKKIKIFDGSAHAQHLFKSKHKEELTKLIIDFIVDQ